MFEFGESDHWRHFLFALLDESRSANNLLLHVQRLHANLLDNRCSVTLAVNFTKKVGQQKASEQTNACDRPNCFVLDSKPRGIPHKRLCELQIPPLLHSNIDSPLFQLHYLRRAHRTQTKSAYFFQNGEIGVKCKTKQTSVNIKVHLLDHGHFGNLDTGRQSSHASLWKHW